MPIVGNLVARVDVRALIAFGLLTGAASLFWMTRFDANIDYSTVAWARAYQSVGLAFLFIPINTIATLGLPPGKSNNASAIINMARNIGSSVGISVATTVLARRQQFHQSMLVEHVTPYSSAYDSTIQSLQQAFRGSSAGAADVLQQAQAQLYAIVQKQAMVLSFVDGFFLMGCAFAVLLPLIFFLRRPTSGARPAAMH
jgi:DHA2 family multidrug resistance protein